MMNRALWIGVIAALALPACGGKKDEDKDEQAQPTPDETTPPEPEEKAPAEPEVVKVENADLSTPESVLYLEDEDIYLVSNINGAPLEADDNGFISRVGPDGKVIELKWIDGAKDDVTLGAPKGMAIRNGTLYVTDIDHVRMFDAKTGAPKGDIPVEGATFLNDLAGAKERLYLTDTGMKATDDGFAPSGSAAVYAISADNELEKLASGDELGAPNGVAAAAEGAWVVTFGSNELYRLDADGKKADVTQLPKGQLDGLVVLPEGDVLVSSWEAKTVYRGKPGGEFRPVVEDVESPADIGWDSKRKRVLIPLFMGDAVVMQTLQ